MPRKYDQAKIYSLHYPDGEMCLGATTQKYLSIVYNAHKRRGWIPSECYIKLVKTVPCDNVEVMKEELRLARVAAKEEFGELYRRDIKDTSYYKNMLNDYMNKVKEMVEAQKPRE
jgi:hypothetical protein